MNQPDQEQIDHWITTAHEGIEGRWMRYKNGFYKKEDISVQSMYTGLALDHASLARAKFLNGDSIEEVHAEFANAARCILKSFTMAYDESDPDYVGDKWPAKNPHYTGLPDSVVEAKWLDPVYGQVSWSEVSEGTFIEGANYALMAADFDLAKELASWFRDPADGVLMAPEVNHYAHDLKSVLMEGRIKAHNRVKTHYETYLHTPPKRNDYKKNYYTLTTALYGIVDNNEALFNQGLMMQLEFYQGYAQGEAKNTTDEFICDHAVALANLGIHHGLNVTVEHDTLPKGLLVKK